MASGSILSIGTSGLLTSQKQLATTSHNISNVNTEGYSRQRTEQEANLPQYSGSGYIGTGVSAQTTVRLADEYLEEQVRNSNSQLGQVDAFLELSEQIDNILANSDSGLTSTLESFFSALQDANDDPSSTSTRQVLLTEAETLASRFQLLDDRFTQLNDQVNQELVNLTQEVTDAARSIAQLNVDIVQKMGAGQGDLPNDLIDQREVLIKQIAENIDVSVVYQDDGAANLFIGSGQSLVVGSVASTLETQQNQFNSQDLDIVMTQGNASVNVTEQISGGQLQGVIDFKQDVLEPTRNGLGRVAIALSEEINAQHGLGMTLQELNGGDFFMDLSGPISGLAGQDSSTTASLTITDSQVLSTSDFRLDNNSGTYVLTRLDDNVSYSANSIADLNTAMSTTEGFTITSDIASGESFLMRPTYDAAASFDVNVNNVLDIALASPIISRQGNDTDLTIPGTTGSAINSGTGDISLPSISNLTNIPLTDDITLTYNDSIPGFDVVGGPGGTIAYDPSTDNGGKSVTFSGYGNITFEITGQPEQGDVFVIENNSDPYDDNRNGLLMTQLQTSKTMENSSTDFQNAYGIIVSDVGTQTYSAQVDLAAQQTLNEQAITDRENYSGVNLDEEAANLLKFQQAYQASARVVSIADEMFQTLINAV